MKRIFVLILSIMYSNLCLADDDVWKMIGPGDADQVTSISVGPGGAVYVGTDIGGVYISRDNGASWRHTNKNLLNHDITTTVVHDGNNNIKYVGTRGGLYKSSDNGKSWSNLRSGLPDSKMYGLSGSIGSIALDPFEENRLYLGMGYRPSSDGNKTVKSLQWSDKIYVSNDKGNSWSPVKLFNNPQKINQILPSENIIDLIYIATEKGLYKCSIKKQKSCKKIYDGEVINVLIPENINDTLIATIARKGVIKTSNGGRSWRSINKGLRFSNHKSGKDRYSVLISNKKSLENIFLVNSTWGRSGGLYSSDNYGESWKLLTRRMPESWLKTSKRMNHVAINPISNEIYLGSSRYIYKSTNNGKTWMQLISRYIDYGWAHTGINVFGHTRKVVAVEDKPEIMYIATADHGMVKSENGGISWNTMKGLDNSLANVWDIALCPNKPEEIYIIGSKLNHELCFSFSQDYGDKWKTNCNIDRSNRNEKIYIQPKSCDSIYVTGSDGIKVSRNQGVTWIQNHKMQDIKVNSLLFDNRGNSVMYAASENGLYISRDYGKDWAQSGLEGVPVTSILQNIKEPNTVFIGTDMHNKQYSSVYKSNDGGKKWNVVLSGIRKYVSGFAQSYLDTDIIYVATNDYNYHDISQGSGVYVTNDNGENWISYNKGLPTKKAFNIMTTSRLPGKVYLSVQGSGVYVTSDVEFIKNN